MFKPVFSGKFGKYSCHRNSLFIGIDYNEEVPEPDDPAGANPKIKEEDVFMANKSVLTKSKKARPRKPLPKWVVPLISIVLVVAIVAGVVVLAMSRTGAFKRMNVLVKSQTSGKYSINQQMAYFLVWNYYYEEAAETWEYYENQGYSSIMSYILGTSNKLDYCWSMAMTAAQSKLNTTVSSSTLLQSYVALCDEGQRNGLQLTKAEKEDAITNMYQVLRSRAYDYYDYLADNGYSVTPSNVYYGNYLEFGRWWKTVFGSDFKESDMEKATVVIAMSNKVLSQWRNDKWESTDAAAEKIANPDRYYKTDYVAYSTTDAALAALLAGVTSEKTLKDLVVNYYVEKNYLEPYNKYVTGKVEEANTVYNKLSGKTTVAELQTALNIYNLTLTEYTQGNETIDEKLAEWLFSDARTGFDATQLKYDDKIVIVVLEGTDPAPETEGGETEGGETEGGETEGGETESDPEPKKVKAATFTVNYVEIATADLTKLQNTLRITLGLTDDETLEHYHSASHEAAEFEEELKEDGADTETLLADATVATDFTATETTVPEVIRDAVFAEGVKVGDVLTVSEDEKVYVVMVKDLKDAVPEDEEQGTPETPAKATVAYKTFEEPMTNVASELETGADSELESIKSDTASYLKPAAVKASETLEKLNASYNKTLFMSNNGATSEKGVKADSKPTEMPEEVYQTALLMNAGEAKLADVADSTTKYVIYASEKTDEGLTVYYLKIETYEVESYQEWLFGTATVVNGEYVSGVSEGDAKVITDEPEEEEGIDTDAETTYTVYLVKNTPMYLETDVVVRGGYLTFMGDDAQKRAEDAKNSLAGKTGYELLKSLSAIQSDANAVASNSLSEDDITSTAVSEWLFDTSRQANEITILEEGGVYYLVVFGARMQSWENSAKTNVASEESTEWVQELISKGGYVISEKALKKIKDVKETIETTEDTTAAA